jgi:Flp pilus assembly protein TadB
MQANQYIQDQLTKLRALQEGKKKALEAQTRTWQKASRVLRRGLLAVRIIAASGCGLPFLMFLLTASNASIGVVAIVVSFLFVAALAVCGVFFVLSRLYEKRKSEMTNGYNETVDMIAVMESLMKQQDGNPSATSGGS